MKNQHLGTNFDDFLAEEGLLDEIEATAIKRVIAYQIEQEMNKQGLTKVEMAQKMNISPSSMDYLLDPQNSSINLQMMIKAALTLGKKLRIELI